jgi:RNA polymerase sigma-70 factor (ECF subfamily)
MRYLSLLLEISNYGKSIISSVSQAQTCMEAHKLTFAHAHATIRRSYPSLPKTMHMAFTETQLLQQVAQQDQQALMVLYQQYGNLVYSLCLRVLRQPLLAEEVTQDVFLKLWRQPQRWNPALGNFSSWLLTIARNAAIDRLRREGRQAPPAWEESGESDNSGMLTSEFAAEQENWANGQALARILLKLPPEQRQLIELAFYEGYTHSELAELLQLPLGTVKTRLRMGMQKLRVLWEESELVDPSKGSNRSVT